VARMMLSLSAEPVTCYGPDPLVPAGCIKNQPIPIEVWWLCAALDEALPTEEWVLVAVKGNRTRRRTFPLGQRRFAALWATECIARGMIIFWA
jgi:hypothetical protein